MQYAKPVTLNVEECDRLSFLPYLFGNDFLYAEASVYALAKKMMPEYEGGFWHFIRLPDGGGYMMPDGDRFHMVNGETGLTVRRRCRRHHLTSLVINRSCGCTTTAGMRTDHLPDARCAVVGTSNFTPNERDLRGTGLINGRGGNAVPVKGREHVLYC
ncbi:antirestriction family protein [Escherichia coli P0304816.10]|nr:antirestriction family protein [Escherichia coli P0304816.10]